jgi:hypothetical protein
MGKLPLFHLKDDLIMFPYYIRRSDIDIAARISAWIRGLAVFCGCFQGAFQDLLLVP